MIDGLNLVVPAWGGGCGVGLCDLVGSPLQIFNRKGQSYFSVGKAVCFFCFRKTYTSEVINRKPLIKTHLIPEK